MSKFYSVTKSLLVVGTVLSVVLASTAMAQEVRYTWVDMSYMVQNAEIEGTKPTLDPTQTVHVNGVDGSGIQFRASAGTWHNLYMFVDFASTDMDVFATVIVDGVEFPAEPDEFDYTTIRAGLGYRIPIGLGSATDLYGEVTYDSINLDFGNFGVLPPEFEHDTDNKDFGAALGLRAMLNDKLELKLYGRYTNHGDVDLTSGEFDADGVYGAGFAWQLVRGFSLVADYESGEFGKWSVGFRLDLDED